MSPRAYSLTNPRRGGPEKLEERRAMTLMATLGFTCWHLSQNRASRQTPGWPDMAFCCPAKRLWVWYEAKSPKGKPSVAQQAFQAEVVACGQDYVVGPASALEAWCADRGLLTVLPSGGYVIRRRG